MKLVKPAAMPYGNNWKWLGIHFKDVDDLSSCWYVLLYKSV